MKPIAVLLASFLVILSCGGARADALDDARTFFYRGEYQAALNLLMPLAKQGNAEAQAKVGEMYYYRLGVFPDCDKAQDWLRRAANQRHAGAARLMGHVYDDGRCVNKNNVQAYMWYSVAETMVPKPARPMGPDDYDAISYPLPIKRKNKDEEANQGLRELIETDRKIVGEVMTMDQIAEAKQLAKNWKPETE